MTALATPDDVVSLTPAEVEYARLLYRSGYDHHAIGGAMGQPADRIYFLARRLEWTRATSHRPSAPLARRVPVLVRCAACCARFGEELGASRPCPHCGALERGDAHV